MSNQGDLARDAFHNLFSGIRPPLPETSGLYECVWFVLELISSLLLVALVLASVIEFIEPQARCMAIFQIKVSVLVRWMDRFGLYRCQCSICAGMFATSVSKCHGVFE